MIKLKRVYEPVAETDGTRFLVERLWPRGIKKEALRLDAWLKDVAPSTALRQWFRHDPDRWNEFRKRYFRELNATPDVLKPILTAAQSGPVTLVYSSHDIDHSNARALREYLKTRIGTRRPARKRAA